MNEPATEKQVNFMRNLKIEVPDGITKTEARLAIDRVLSKEEKPEVVKIPDKPKSNGNGSMYAAYAKDIFCGFLMYKKEGMISDDELMALSIKLVKQAKEAFE